MTSFQAFSGSEPPKWKEYPMIDTKVQAVRNQLDEEQKMIKILKENLTIACNTIEEQANWNWSERQFEEGDWMFFILQPYKYLSHKQQGKNKLAPNFYEPFQIDKKISKVIYCFKWPENCHIHIVFHVSYLTKMLGHA